MISFCRLSLLETRERVGLCGGGLCGGVFACWSSDDLGTGFLLMGAAMTGDRGLARFWAEAAADGRLLCGGTGGGAS